MANYIKTLQESVSDLLQAKNSAMCRISEARALLLSAKHQGIASDGSRNDWIATSDVLRMLEEIRTALDE